MPTSDRFIRLTVADCMPIAAATVASRQNCAHPVGRVPLTSNPSVNPAIRMNWPPRAPMTCDGSPLARLSSLVCAGVALKPRAIQVLPATPAM